MKTNFGQRTKHNPFQQWENFEIVRQKSEKHLFSFNSDYLSKTTMNIWIGCANAYFDSLKEN